MSICWDAPQALCSHIGKPVPTGTAMVLVDYQSDVLTRYLVGQKVDDGAEDWEYQWFWPRSDHQGG